MTAMMYRLLLAIVLPAFAMAVTCNMDNNGGQPCVDQYCVYLKTRETAANLLSVRRACLAYPQISYNRSFEPYTLVNVCSQITIDGIEYTMKICDQDYCNYLCENPLPFYPLPTTTTPKTGGAATASLAVLPVILLAALM